MDRWIDQVQGHSEQWRHVLTLLQNGTLPHALAFVGPAGIGKKKMAYALAQAGLCTGGNPPCGACPACARVQALRSEAMLVVAMSGGQLKLEQAQSVLHFLQLRAISAHRFVIVDDAVNMNATFANALLKILEEPPAGTHFIFLLPALSQLLPTLRSRLQVVRFFPLSDDIVARVSGVSEWMVRAAQGSFAALEEWSSEEASALKAKAVAALADLAGSRRAGFESLLPAIKEREAAELVTRLMQQFLRDVLHLQSGLKDVVHADAGASLQVWANKTRGQVLAIWREAFRLQTDIAANLDRSLCFENFFVRSRRLLENANAILD